MCGFGFGGALLGLVDVDVDVLPFRPVDLLGLLCFFCGVLLCAAAAAAAAVPPIPARLGGPP